MTFVEKQLQSGTKDLAWSCLSWLTGFWLLSSSSTSWYPPPAFSFPFLDCIMPFHPWSLHRHHLSTALVLTLSSVFIPCNCHYFFFLKVLFIYSWETHSETELQAESEAGSLGGSWCGTQSQDSGIQTWAKGRSSTTEPPGCPTIVIIITHQSPSTNTAG